MLDRKTLEGHFAKRQGYRKQQLNKDELLSSFDDTARMVDEQIKKFKQRQQYKRLQPSLDLNSDIESINYNGDEPKTPFEQRSSFFGETETERETTLLDPINNYHSDPSRKQEPVEFNLEQSDLFI